jgi:hypothetical protein
MISHSHGICLSMQGPCPLKFAVLVRPTFTSVHFSHLALNFAPQSHFIGRLDPLPSVSSVQHGPRGWCRGVQHEPVPPARRQILSFIGFLFIPQMNNALHATFQEIACQFKVKTSSEILKTQTSKLSFNLGTKQACCQGTFRSHEGLDDTHDLASCGA